MASRNLVCTGNFLVYVCMLFIQFVAPYKGPFSTFSENFKKVYLRKGGENYENYL